MKTIKMSRKGRLSVPKEIREAAHISPGSILTVEEQKGAVVLKLAPTQPGKESEPKQKGNGGTRAAPAKEEK